ncbi:MAG: hypothetical protein JST11_16845 [Acidobacteria bacterium]|nr:hypothetical protein [Acidobacteriota bacterium]
MFIGRDVVRHDRNVDDPILDGLLSPPFSTTYAGIDPYRSVLISDCTQGASWCRQPSFAICSLLGDAIGTSQASIAGRDWYLSMLDDGAFVHDTQSWGGTPCNASLALLAVVNRMDLARTSDGSLWSEAELRFVYGAGRDFNLILEFVLPDFDWPTFQSLGKSWAALSNLDPKGADFTAALSRVVSQTRYVSAPKIRLRMNRSTTGQEWQLGQWNFTRDQILKPGVPLAPADLDDQLPKGLISAEQFREVASATPPDAKSVHMPRPFASGLTFYFLPARGMPLPEGVPPDPSSKIRNMVSLQQCTWCHTAESGTEFVQIGRGDRDGSVVLSHFLTGAAMAKPTIQGVYYADCATVACVDVCYRGQDCSQRENKVQRRFHDLGRRLLLLTAVVSARSGGATPSADELARITAFTTDFSH